MTRHLWISGGLLGVLLLDQWTKILARGPLRDAGPLSYFGGLLRLETVENPGAFLSFGASWSDGARQIFFHFGVIAILAFTAYLLWRQRQNLLSAAGLTCVLAGGIGNLIDRLLKGTVTDFIILGTSWIRTGVFNVADFAIVVGLVLLVWPQPGTAQQKKIDPV